MGYSIAVLFIQLDTLIPYQTKVGVWLLDTETAYSKNLNIKSKPV